MSQGPKVEVEGPAIADLDRIDRFLRQKNPNAANRLGPALWAVFTRIAEAPRIGRRWAHAPPGSEVRERLMPFGQSVYIIRYAIAPDRISILRIHHAREER